MNGNGIMQIALFLLFVMRVVEAHKNGAPCAAQYSMRPNQQYHGPPQDPEENPVPYYFSITDSKGQPINHYKGDEVYTIRLYGGKSYFRGFLIQARLATRDRFVIGHLRSGEFLLQPESLERYGVQVQPCPPGFNDSVTHVDSSEKKFLELNWKVSQNDGPIQFMLTVVKDRNEYWSEWKPDNGFLLPDENYGFKKQASQKFGHAKLSFSLTSSSPNLITEKRIVESKTEHEESNKPKTTLGTDDDYIDAEDDTTKSAAHIAQKTTAKISTQESTASNEEIEETDEASTTSRKIHVITEARKIETVPKESVPEEEIEEEDPSVDSSVVVHKLSTNNTTSVLTFKNFKPEESVRLGPIITKTQKGSTFNNVVDNKESDNTSDIFPPKIKNRLEKLLETTLRPAAAVAKDIGKNGAVRFVATTTSLKDKSVKASRASTNKPSDSDYDQAAIPQGPEGNPCEQNPCRNGGHCVVDTDGGFVCNCTSEYAGFDCSQLDFCRENKCKNGGICVNSEKEYKCECQEGFVGDFCQVQCAASFCQNEGECIASEDNKPMCACTPGFNGSRCESDIDECASNPCVAGATCENRKNAFHCTCPDGFMGDRCHRPCQDIYKSCTFWRDQDQCELRRPSTNFFDVNCAVSCEQCVFDNNTVVTDTPVPPALEPLEFLLGQWYVNSTSPQRVPIDFANSSGGYYEELEISCPYVPMFGAPSFNYSSLAISHNDKRDFRITVGFITLKPSTNQTPVSLMTTENGGITLMEEGLLKNGEIKLEIVYVATLPGVKDILPASVKRTLTVRNGFLQESVTKTSVDGKEDSYTKYYYRKT